MKSIFKKIALVLALAMVVTMLPAKSVSVSAADASANKWTRKTCTLYIDNPVEGDKDGIYVSSAYATAAPKVKDPEGWKAEGYSVVFASDDETVATVGTRYGLVEAVGIGQTTITATYSKEGAADVVESFPVTVKRAAASVALDDESAKAVQELVVGADPVELKAVMTDAAGNVEVVEKTSDNGGKLSELLSEGRQFVTDYLKYDVKNPEDKEVLKVEGNKLSAVAEGEATLVVKAYRYDWQSWGKTKSKYVKVVTAQTEVPVTVKAAGLVSAKQVSYTTVALTCDSTDAAEAIAKDFSKLTVTYKMGDNDIAAFVKAANVDGTDKKVVNVELYNAMNKDVEYTFTYNEKSVSLRAVDPDAVVGIRITTTSAQPGEGEDLKVDYLGENGVIVRGNDSFLTFEAADPNSTEYSVSGNQVFIFEAGKTATVKASYYMGVDANGNLIPDLKDEKVIICRTTTADNMSGYAVAAAGKKASDLTYSTGILSLVKDENVQLYAKYTAKQYNDKVVTYYNISSALDEMETGVTFKYKSTNESVVIAGEMDGILYPVGTGSAQIIISNDKGVAVGAVTVSVVASRVLTSFSADQAGMTKISTADYGVNFRIFAKDQFSNWLGQGNEGTKEIAVSAKIIGGSFNGVVKISDQWGKYGDNLVEINRNDFTPIPWMNNQNWCSGVCGIGVENATTTVQSLQIQLKAEREGIVRYAVLNYTVKAPENTARTYAIDSAEIDVNFVNAKDALTKELKLKSYDRDGFLINDNVTMTNVASDKDVAKEAFGYTVTKNGQSIRLGADNTFYAVTTSGSAVTSGSAITFEKKVGSTNVDSVGTYVVRVFYNNGSTTRVVANNTIVVKDTTGADTVTISNNKVLATDEASLIAKFNAGLADGSIVIYHGGKKAENVQVVGVGLPYGLTGSSTTYVQSITVEETNKKDGVYKDYVYTYKVTVGKVFEVGQ